MKLRGNIVIDGMTLTAIATVEDTKRAGVARYGDAKWQAYRDAGGARVHLGYYADKADAELAASTGENIARYRKVLTAGIAGRIWRDDAGAWNAWCNARKAIVWQASSFGEAVLRFDVLARISDQLPIVPNYKMPIGFVDNDEIIRIFDVPILEPTAKEIDDYKIMVESLNKGFYNVQK